MEVILVERLNPGGIWVHEERRLFVLYCTQCPSNVALCSSRGAVVLYTAGRTRGLRVWHLAFVDRTLLLIPYAALSGDRNNITTPDSSNSFDVTWLH